MEPTKLLDKCKVIRRHLIEYLRHKKDEFNPEEFNNKNSLAPIIGTICDEQISTEVAWEIPLHLSQWLKQENKEFKASEIQKLGKQRLRTWLSHHMHDKWPKKMPKENREEWLDKISKSVIRSCQKISMVYNDDPDRIFMVNNGILPIPLVYFILRQFDGIGPKKASMIARDFGRECSWLRSVRERLHNRGIDVRINDIYFTEMPIDVHIRRVFQRLGFIRYRYSEPQDFQNLARLIYPKNPGLVDDFIWDLGRKTCKNYPICEKCSLSGICEYKGGSVGKN